MSRREDEDQDTIRVDSEKVELCIIGIIIFVYAPLKFTLCENMSVHTVNTIPQRRFDRVQRSSNYDHVLYI